MQFHHDNPDLIWINPGSPCDGHGSFEQPYSSIEEGLKRIRPGQALILFPGNYVSDLTIQVSGTARRPIHICAAPGATVTISSACWFFYDTSDLVVSGLTFTDAQSGAISVIGRCSRNRFDDLRFINCGVHKEAACALYFGGAGGCCNIVENCSFEHAPREKYGGITPNNASIGLMIAQGDAATGSPIVNSLVRRNRFVNYGYGILVGGEESGAVRCGHIIEYNTVQNCSHGGILIKSGDTLARGNVVEGCPGDALSVQSELDCTVEGNRIIDCLRGIVVRGRGHTVADNCLVRCGGGAIRVDGASAPHCGASSNCFIERNTFVNCSSPSDGDDPPVAGILIDAGTTGIVERNLIYGAGKPYAVVQASRPARRRGGRTSRGEDTRFVIRDNAADGGCSLLDGVETIAVKFADPARDDYRNGCGSGASGWVLAPQGFDPAVDETPGSIDYREASILEDDNGEFIIPGENEECRGNLFGHFFAGAAEDDEGMSTDYFSENEA
ncbi:MAG: right-handed parallel beta-helix repeat-containing protein [Chitinispirillaceae bacterium]|nr:right-handed parallel beta-helix repeat-containing protein [Chitinispirillaceae bacterium]